MKAANINNMRLESIPYQELFNQRIKLEKWAEICIWSGGIFTLFHVFGGDIMLSSGERVIDIIERIILFAGVVLTWGAEIYCGPVAEFERVGGSIDNGYETCILSRPVDSQYYNNGIEEKGYRRLAANYFESCFFTDKISSKMTYGIVAINAVFLCLFTILTMVNLNANQITSLIRILVGSVLFGRLIKHWYFRHCISGVLEQFKLIHGSLAHDSEEFQARAVYLIIKYEKSLSHYNQSLDSKVFGKMNEQLSAEWEEMKKRYKITADQISTM